MSQDVFHFYPTKQITTGEGGMLITNSKKIYSEIKKIKAFGIDKDITERKKQGEYDVKSLGFNYRMTDFQSALGFMQLKRYKNNLLKRKSLAKRYISKLKRIKDIVFSRIFFKRIIFYFSRFYAKEEMIYSNTLKKEKIGVSVHYKKHLPDMTYYKQKYNLNQKDFLNAKNYAYNNISLPCYPKMKFSEVDFICGKFAEFYEKN